MSVENYQENTFPYAVKYHLQGSPRKISYDEYVKHFRPRIRVAKNKFVTAPKFGLAGLCLDVSRHKKKAQKKVKVKPFGSEEIKKVPLDSVFGLPELTGGSIYFLRDMRTKFWYKGIAPMSAEGLKVDAVMVRSEPEAKKKKQKHTQKGGGTLRTMMLQLVPKPKLLLLLLLILPAIKPTVLKSQPLLSLLSNLVPPRHLVPPRPLSHLMPSRPQRLVILVDSYKGLVYEVISSDTRFINLVYVHAYTSDTRL